MLSSHNTYVAWSLHIRRIAPRLAEVRAQLDLCCFPRNISCAPCRPKSFRSPVLPVHQVVVVLSGSMEPGFYRGDILFLNMGTAPIRVGEIVVFNIDGRDVPIVHRVVKVHERLPGGDIDILTKVPARCSSPN